MVVRVIHDGIDLRACCSGSPVSRFLRMPRKTLKSWRGGQPWGSGTGQKSFPSTARFGSKCRGSTGTPTRPCCTCPDADLALRLTWGLAVVATLTTWSGGSYVEVMRIAISTVGDL